MVALGVNYTRFPEKMPSDEAQFQFKKSEKVCKHYDHQDVLIYN